MQNYLYDSTIWILNMRWEKNSSVSSSSSAVFIDLSQDIIIIDVIIDDPKKKAHILAMYMEKVK